ncbi:MAG: O-acetylhomoserine aminocarboxypropyltransferase/cysteine synthase, partial [Paracoccus sp. (in: a-proteobacteria)]|nr:O-acetylhomoserine aminocarboxypropyltransferase/cysteine synthase [Paracoccus sp. (in: a-proteobacteria)]
VPIYQTTAYVFRDADHAAKLFNLQEVGYIYSRLTNPTVAALQARVAALEGGAGAVCCSSGHAAQIMALFPLMGPGKNIVASTRLYGGTITQFSQTIKRFGWGVKFVDLDDLDALKAAIDDDTRAVFCESISNPGGYVTDITAVAQVADAAGIPLIVDNTLATPFLCKPIEMGATLVVHSLTKYMTGNGTVTGGVVVDSGRFDWSASDKFPSLSAPEPAYHGLKFHETFGNLAFTFHGIAIGLRDLGMTMNPQAAHYTLMGIETLGLRMERHVANALKVAQWLEADPRVESVTYAGLASSPWNATAKRLYPKGAGALFTFAIRGGYDAAVKLVDHLKLFSHVANLGDTRSLVIHSASTTHRQLTEDQQRAAGAGPEVVRLSIGIEDADDLIADLDQALAAAT